MPTYDAVVVGAGPNGLAAAVVLARAGLSVLLREGAPTIGGGMRTQDVTLPGFHHDICSAIHPLGIASPLFRTLPLHEHGLRWIHPTIPLAHPLDDGPPACLYTDIERTGATLGEDGERWRALLEPFVERFDALALDALAPLHWPRHPLLLARFGLKAFRSLTGLARAHFRGPRARALLAGISAHSIVPLDRLATASYGLMLAIAAHAVGWPIPEGGSQRIATALASYLRSLGGEIVTGAPVRTLDELPRARVVLLDVTPRQMLRMAGRRLPSRYRRALRRFRYGPGVFKVDWALDGPVPWRDAECREAGTVHLGGSMERIARAERQVWYGGLPERPYVLLAQQSLFDPGRAPAGRQTLWGYCHVPNGSPADMTERIERMVEREAPGFRELILARRTLDARGMEAHDPNYVGGDISGGANTVDQLFFRPVVRRLPYATPVPGLYFCSSSTPPGGGVHGMCGYHAAREALREHFPGREPELA